jgi:hypothetical protein
MLPHDPHVGPNGEYRVRSLYFDTPDDKALREKTNGVDRREKFRVRRYLDDDAWLSLEKKTKQNSLSGKQSARLTRDELERLLRGDLDWMPNASRPLVAELYSKMKSELLRPKAIVDYIREPFYCLAGNVRITLDRDIRTGLHETGSFFDDGMPTVQAGDEIVLLEVKYDAFIPDFIVSLLQLDSRQAASASKYAMSRIYG